MKGNTMKMTWILAQTGNGEAPSTITSEPVGSEDVETMTKEAADPNAGPGTGARRGPFGDFWTIGLIAIMMIVVFTFFAAAATPQDAAIAGEERPCQDYRGDDRDGGGN
jgi:hypothetical protein